ncbi:MAG: class I SAM-dependent methyltransferase [Spirochaetaceae bacterium]|nr:class I SAM-dependent methyltransferase [Myxococcales bacterium]MCB9723792.1 class I SAM-dependent methyltransferase [Spirochaetaceae bacterium]
MSSLARFWPRRVGPAEPLAAALLDHHRSARPRRVHATRADGVLFEIETEEYFTLEGTLAELDRAALERCRGRVLDVGAGAGRHALALQGGLEVVAIDVSPLCTALCRERGVRDARTLDVMRLEADASLGRFDTILFGMQTIGVAGGTLALERLLGRLRHRLEPGGGILADSSALREPWEGDATDRSASRGEIVLSTRYRGWRGEPFPWLYLAEEDLCEVAGRAGFGMETLARAPDGEFLALLQPRSEG